MSTTALAPRELTNIIAGSEAPVADLALIDRRAPGTDEIVARVPASTTRDVDTAVAAARRAFEEGPWRHFTGAERSAAVGRLADLIESNAARLAVIEAEETGKPITLAEDDIAGAVSLCRYAAALALSEHGQLYTSSGPDFTGLVLREPVGVAGLIVPWNFPALILCQKLPFALAAGCTVVIKPSELTSTTSWEITKFAAEAGFPDGVVNLVLGDGVAGQALADSRDVDLISFTGSTVTGRKIVTASAGNLKRTSLELGGKAATIVFDDADLADAAAGVVFGMSFNNGECCVSQPRLLVQRSVAEDFLADVTRLVGELRVGQPMDRRSDVGALIHAGHLDKVASYIDQAPDFGADILIGGGRLRGGEYGNGQFIRPAVIDGVRPGTPAFQEEIFGPVLTVTRFDTADEAIALANGVNYGLSNSLWSKNIDRVLDTAKALRSGSVYVNTAIDGPPQMPFGGMKASGIGREKGEIGFEEFTEVKSVSIRTGSRAGKFLLPSLAG
jgi:acyl-CoA reductase-like NAD-dependent aldehyde dehydrogenase